MTNLKSARVPKLKDIKNWGPEVEKSIADDWKKSELFKFDSKTKKKIYSIDTPPPYVNAPIHMGHAVTYAYQDFFARYKRMKGFEVLFPLGLDRNGLPIEMGAEKKYGVSPFVVGREKFVDYCEKMLNETSTESTDSFARIGISFTSYKAGNHIGGVYFTDSPEYRALTQATFIELYKKGLIYEDSRINNWDPKLRTTISDSEIDYKDVPSFFNDIEWSVEGTKEKIVIGTTRPELIGSCGMVIFHPSDNRYKKLEGKKAITPLFGKEVPIKAHPLANPEKGTGIVMMCSAGDLSDIQFFREQNIEPIISINKDGTMNSKAGFLEGLKVKDARQKIIEELKTKGLLKKQEKITHRTPVSERSGAEVEFIEMPEFYLKQLQYKNEIKRLSKKINFYPESSKKILDDWIESVSIDWPISRRRFYATEIPLWYGKDEKDYSLVVIPEPGKYYRPWKEAPPKGAEVYRESQKAGKVGDKIFKNIKWKGEERVLDTWFDSSISELFILNYKKDNNFFKKAYPATLRPQGKEIVRTWLYYTLLRGYLETGEPCFKDVWIHQHILDSNGRKMSKSLGNIIDPQEILKEFGCEALRWWSALEGDLSKQDLSCSKEKIRGEAKTLNKILNVSKFIMQFAKPLKKPKITQLDQLFIDYVEEITRLSEEEYDVYDFHNSARRLRYFIWELLASHYLEVVKARVYNQENVFSKTESESAKWTLHFLLERFLFLAYPIIPMMTSLIAGENKINLFESNFPKAVKGKSDLKLIDDFMDFNKMIWKEKKENGLSLREGISKIEIPKLLSDFDKDLRVCHNLK